MKALMKKTLYDIKVTFSLLHKPESELTKLEKEAIARYKDDQNIYLKKLVEANERLKKYCKILCSGSQCENNLIPDYGWEEPISNMAYKLEKLNYFYKPWHMKVQFAQTKEKFGAFRGYWDIIERSESFWARFFDRIYRFLSNRFDYGNKKVIDSQARVTLEWEECTANDHKKKLDRFGKKLKNAEEFDSHLESVIYLEGTVVPEQTTYFKYDKNAKKHFRSYWCRHAAKWHYEITKHKILHKILDFSKRLAIKFDSKPSSPMRFVMYMNFYEEVQEIVRQCEKECEARCQICGNRIDEHGWHDKCETSGWITYICDRCAMAQPQQYFNHKKNKWMKEDKCIHKSKQK